MKLELYIKINVVKISFQKYIFEHMMTVSFLSNGLPYVIWMDPSLGPQCFAFARSIYWGY